MSIAAIRRATERWADRDDKIQGMIIQRGFERAKSGEKIVEVQQNAERNQIHLAVTI